LQGALRMICLMYLKQIKASEDKRRPPADALPFRSLASGGSPMGSWLLGRSFHAFPASDPLLGPPGVSRGAMPGGRRGAMRRPGVPAIQALGLLSRAGVKGSRPGGSEDSGALRTARPLHARRIDFPLPCPSRSPLSRFPSCAGSMAPFIRRRSARAGVAGSAARRRAASLAGEARFAIAVSVPEPEAVGGPQPARWDPRA
jgi:hypothetical protein